MNISNPKMQVLFRWISFLYRFSGFQPLILQFFAAESAIEAVPLDGRDAQFQRDDDTDDTDLW